MVDSFIHNTTAANTAIAKPTQKRKRPATRPPLRVWLRRFSPLLTFGLLLLAWHLITANELYPAFLIPPPADVAETFVEVVQDGTLWKHTSVTLQEMTFGLLIGVSLALLIGYLIAKIPLLEDILAPVIVAFQSTPIVAYAPLLIIWFGTGMTSKIITCAIIVFFPTLMNTIVGIRSIPSGLRDVMRALRANRWQMFIKLEVPAAMPVLLTGLKTSATLAVIGAVVGEFINASVGLGTLITLARNQYNTPLVFVAVFTMTALALSFYAMVSLLEWRLLAWQRRSGH